MSVIRQTGKSQNGCFKKTKPTKFFRKTNISYPLIRTVLIRGQEMFVFRKIWRALFSRNPRFEIRPFVLLPTKQDSENILNKFSGENDRMWGNFYKVTRIFLIWLKPTIEILEQHSVISLLLTLNTYHTYSSGVFIFRESWVLLIFFMLTRL